MAAGMADLLPGLLLCLMAEQTVQLHGKSAVFIFVGLFVDRLHVRDSYMTDLRSVRIKWH